MSRQNTIFTLSILIAVYELPMCITQESLTFSPSTPLCIGEEVMMTCFVVPPTAQPFTISTALLSFNGSTALSPSAVTDANTIGGIDVRRYTASTDGLTISEERAGVRLSISNYQATDGYIVFGCHGVYSGLVPTPIIISSQPQGLAHPISALEGSTVITILSGCAIQISFSVTQITSNRLTGLTYTFSLSDWSVVLESKDNVTDSLTPSVTFSSNIIFMRDVCYGITVSVKNCANEGDGATASPTYFSLQGIRNSTGILQTSFTDSSRIEWKYNNTVKCLNNYKELILTKDIFIFTLIKNNSVAYTITEYSLYLPNRFDFYIPLVMRSDEYSLRISLCNQTLTDQDIPITLLTVPDGTVTTVLGVGVLAGLLIILFSVIVILIVLLLLFIYLKRINQIYSLI